MASWAAACSTLKGVLITSWGAGMPVKPPWCPRTASAAGPAAGASNRAPRLFVVETHAGADGFVPYQPGLPDWRGLAHVVEPSERPGQIACLKLGAEAASQRRRRPPMVGQQVTLTQLVGAVRPRALPVSYTSGTETFSPTAPWLSLNVARRTDSSATPAQLLVGERARVPMQDVTEYALSLCG